MLKALQTLLLSSSLLFGLTANVWADETLQNIINSEQRSSENAARDSHRHPAETLQFFGLTADMQVAEIWPGKGWYT